MFPLRITADPWFEYAFFALAVKYAEARAKYQK